MDATSALPDNVVGINEADWTVEMKRPGGRRVAFISASEASECAETLKASSVLKDVNGDKWFKIFHSSLPPVSPGGVITVVDRTLSPIEQRPRWPEQDAQIASMIIKST